MRKFIVSAIIASQALGGLPARSATIVDSQASARTENGAFAGARARLPLGPGPAGPRLGLAVASTQRNGATGPMRFSEGVDYSENGQALSAIREVAVLVAAGMPNSRTISAPFLRKL